MRLKFLAREPLLHFVVLGLAIFFIDQSARSAADNPKTIIINEEVRDELVTLFEKSNGRKPNAKQYELLIERWLYDEVMYREALALGLDKGDKMFRSRLEVKLRGLLINSVNTAPPTRDDLHKWLKENFAQYFIPERFDFQQFPIEAADAAQAAKIAATLSNEGDEAELSEAYKDKVRSYSGRSKKSVAAIFGEEFAAALPKIKMNKWNAVRSKKGWHLLRVVDRLDAVKPEFESLKNQLAHDWTKFQNKRLAKEAFADIRKNYDVLRKDRP